MIGWLLDVNVLLGCAWKSHAGHPDLLGWLLEGNDWATCPLTESAFMRISMTTAYRATFDNARKSLATLRALRGHIFQFDDVDAAMLPLLTCHRQVHPRRTARRHDTRRRRRTVGLREAIRRTVSWHKTP